MVFAAVFCSRRNIRRGEGKGRKGGLRTKNEGWMLDGGGEEGGREGRMDEGI